MLWRCIEWNSLFWQAEKPTGRVPDYYISLIPSFWLKCTMHVASTFDMLDLAPDNFDCCYWTSRLFFKSNWTSADASKKVGCAIVPQKLGLLKIRAKSLKIWVKSLKIQAKTAPNLCRKTHVNLFLEVIPKRGLHKLCGSKFVGKIRTRTFHASLGKFGKKFFATPKICLLWFQDPNPKSRLPVFSYQTTFFYFHMSIVETTLRKWGHIPPDVTWLVKYFHGYLSSGNDLFRACTTKFRLIKYFN